MTKQNGGNGARDPLLEDIERRALLGLPEESEEDEAPELLDALRQPDTPKPARDLTLRGYIDTHDRPPAFEGIDGQPYTVAVDSEQTDDAARPFAAFLIFIRWAATGAGIMDHVESRDIAFGESAEDARDAALDLSLYEIKAELDAAIERKRTDMES